jgi:hypothetical protein
MYLILKCCTLEVYIIIYMYIFFPNFFELQNIIFEFLK